MSTELYALKGVISEMPIDDQKQIKEACDKFREILSTYGDAGFIAFSLVGCEICAFDELSNDTNN